MYSISRKSLNKRLISGRILWLRLPTHWMQFCIHLAMSICVCMHVRLSVFRCTWISASGCVFCSRTFAMCYTCTWMLGECMEGTLSVKPHVGIVSALLITPQTTEWLSSWYQKVLATFLRFTKLPFSCTESEATPSYIHCTQCPSTCRSLHMISFTRPSPMLVLQATKG